MKYDKLSKLELINLCRTKNIKNYSKLNKNEIIQLIKKGGHENDLKAEAEEADLVALKNSNKKASILYYISGTVLGNLYTYVKIRNYDESKNQKLFGYVITEDDQEQWLDFYFKDTDGSVRSNSHWDDIFNYIKKEKNIDFFDYIMIYKYNYLITDIKLKMLKDYYDTMVNFLKENHNNEDYKNLNNNKISEYYDEFYEYFINYLKKNRKKVNEVYKFYTKKEIIEFIEIYFKWEINKISNNKLDENIITQIIAILKKNITKNKKKKNTKNTNIVNEYNKIKQLNDIPKEKEKIFTILEKTIKDYKLNNSNFKTIKYGKKKYIIPNFRIIQYEKKKYIIPISFFPQKKIIFINILNSDPSNHKTFENFIKCVVYDKKKLNELNIKIEINNNNNNNNNFNKNLYLIPGNPKKMYYTGYKYKVINNLIVTDQKKESKRYFDYELIMKFYNYYLSIYNANKMVKIKNNNIKFEITQCNNLEEHVTKKMYLDIRSVNKVKERYKLFFNLYNNKRNDLTYLDYLKWDISRGNLQTYLLSKVRKNEILSGKNHNKNIYLFNLIKKRNKNPKILECIEILNNYRIYGIIDLYKQLYNDMKVFIERENQNKTFDDFLKFFRKKISNNLNQAYLLYLQEFKFCNDSKNKNLEIQMKYRNLQNRNGFNVTDLYRTWKKIYNFVLMNKNLNKNRIILYMYFLGEYNIKSTDDFFLNTKDEVINDQLINNYSIYMLPDAQDNGIGKSIEKRILYLGEPNDNEFYNCLKNVLNNYNEKISTN